MARIHTGLKSAKFEKPDRIQSVTVCSETGKKATTGCPHTNLEYFLWFTTPDLCDKHHGKEVQNTKKDSTESENKEKEIIQGITNEIDEKEPPRTNNHTTNSMVTQDENKKQNETMNNNTNQVNTTNTTENQTSDNHNTTNSNVNQNTTSNMNTENTNITLNTTTNDTEL
ncbi:MAG: hypothetical protein HFJ37_03830 [Clostridia bacterium]|nr:hypothetical protein [Clostridia bacterium]